MKILAAIVIPPHLSASGAVNAAVSLSRSLLIHCGVQIDVALMADETSDTLSDGLLIRKRRATNRLGFTRRFLPNKFRTLFYRSDISELIKDYDLVHLHNPIPAIEMRSISRACRKLGKPYVVTTHGFVEVLGLQSAYRLGPVESFVGRKLLDEPVTEVVKYAAKICCLAPFDHDLLIERGVASHRLTVIPNGVSPGAYRVPSGEEMHTVCKKFGLPVEKSTSVPTCFFLANHTRNKGLDVLLDAFVQTERPYCLIVGGKKRSFDYESYSKRVRPGQRMIFTDMLTDDELHCLHHYADLFVFPTRADTLPLVILDAMAAGTPILSTTVGGVPFQVSAECGTLVPPEDLEAVRRAFEAMVADPVSLRAKGDAARNRAKLLFDWDKSAEATLKVYEEALGLSSLPTTVLNPPHLSSTRDLQKSSAAGR